MPNRFAAYPARPTGVATGLVAAGTTQLAATPIPLRNGLVEVSTVASGTGVILPVIAIPGEIKIRNAGANALAVYPQPGGTIDGGTVNAAISVPPGNSAILWASSGTNWYTATFAGGSAGAGGSPGQIQYNAAGALAGATSLTIGSGGQLHFGAIAAPGSPADGDEWQDSTQGCRIFRRAGANLFTGGTIYNQIAVADTGVWASTAFLSLINTTGAIGTVSLPAGFMNVAGRRLRLSGGGWMSTAASAAGTANFALYFGATVLAPTGALTLVTSKTNAAWSFDIVVTCRATGASGKLDIFGLVQGKIGLVQASPFVGGVICNSSGGSTTAVDQTTPVTIDLTAAYVLDFKVSLSTGGAVNTNRILMNDLNVEVLN